MKYIPMTMQKKERIRKILDKSSNELEELKEPTEEQIFRDMTHYEVISNFNMLNEEEQKEVLRELIKDFKGNKVKLLRKLSNTIHL